MTGIDPSFYHSLAYLELAGAECYQNVHWMWVELEGWIALPPLQFSADPKTLGNESIFFPGGDIWCAGLKEELSVWSNYQPELLDLEYIFDPAEFNHMDGGKWNTFRKNVRKWPRENPEWIYTDDLIAWDPLPPLMGEWLEDRAADTEDAELMLKMVFSARSDVGKKFMYNGKQTPGNSYGDLVGVNVWDMNYKYVNYRLCIAKPGERFLDEFMRYQFYMDEWLWLSGKKVNDGGSIGRSGLERFKDKMNPLIKRKRYSLIKSKHVNQTQNGEVKSRAQNTHASSPNETIRD